MRRGLAALLFAIVFAACFDDVQEIGPGSVVSVTIFPDSLDLRIGDSIQLRAFPIDASGALRPGRPVTWSVDRPDLASVSDSGLVTGLGEGAVSVSAVVDRITGQGLIAVAPAPRLVISGDSVAFEARAGDPDPPPDTLMITNGGGFSLAGLTVDSVVYDSGATDWIMAAIDSAAAPTTLRLIVMSTGITQPATYGARVVVTATDADSAPQDVRTFLTITPGAPAAMAAMAGDSQTAVVNTPVATSPSVRVEDAFGNGVPDVDVVFSVTGGGGDLLPAGAEVQADADTVPTDSSGIAAVPAWTLGTTVGTNTIEATLPGTAVPAVAFTATGTPAGPAQLTKTQGDAQSGTAGAPVAVVPQVRVLDAFGNAVPSVPVAFTAPPGNGAVSGGSPTSDASGFAAVGSWTLDSAAGPDTLLATSAGVSDTARFTAQSLAGAAASIALGSGDAQSDSVGATLAQNPSVLVTDVFGNPVAGFPVTFTVSAGGGSVSDSSAVTDAAGLAATAWTLGGTPGANTLLANAAGLAGSPVTFSATATAGAPTQMTITAGDAQSATVETAVAVAPAVRLTDQFGNSVAGVTVTFSVTGGGGSVTGASAVTGGTGIARVGSWTLGPLTGANTLQATAGALSASFTATGTAAAADTIFAVAGGGQTATVNQAVTTAPSVRITDQFGNPVSGVAVSFVVTSGGGTVGGGTSVTDATGTASVASWTLGTAAGTNTLTASVGGLTGSPVTFTATAVADVADSIAIVAGNGQTATVGTAVPTAPRVRVLDAFGNRVPGVEVTFAVQSGGGSVSGATDTTDGSGEAGAGSWTLGPAVGANTLSATAAGAGITDNPPTFTATATAGAPDTLAIVQGDGQTATAGTAVAVPPGVRVVDRFGNPVQGVLVTFTPSGDGSVNPGGGVSTGVGGTATLTSWTLASTAGANTLTASITAPGVSGNPAMFTATGQAGAAGALTILTQPSAAAVSGTPLAQQPVVQLTDGLGNPVTTAGVAVGATIASGPGGTLGGTDTVLTDGAGQAVFTDLVITGLVGSYQIAFGGTDLSGATSTSIALSAGPADTVFASAGAVQTDTAGAPVAVPPAVTVTDVAGNPIAGVAVTFGVTGGGGSMLPADGLVNTNPSGVAALSAWTLGTVAGANTLTATVSGLNGSPVPFSATGVAGAPDSLRIVAGNAQTDTVAATLSVDPSVIVVDQFGNPIQGRRVGFTVTGGGGSVSPDTVTTGPGGTATVTSWTLGSTPGTNTLTAGLAGAGVTGNPAAFTATATVGSPSATLSTVSATVPGGLSVSPGDERATINVTVVDGLGNAISGAGVTLASTVGSDSIVQPGVTNASGQTSGSVSGTVDGGRNISATVNGSVLLNQSPSVSLLPDPLDPAVSSVTTSRASIGASSGSDTTTITVTAADQFGNPLSGVGVSLATTVNGDFGTPSDITDGSGQFTSTFSASTPLGDRRISALANGTTDLADTVTVTLTAGPVSPGTSTVDRGAATITASDGSSTSLITVTVRDAFNNPVEGAAVSLAANGSDNSFTAAANTDASGQTTSSFSSTQAIVKTVTATADAVGITDDAMVTVNPDVANSMQTTDVIDDSSILASNTGGSSNRRTVMTVTVRDQFGNVRQGDIVTFTPSDANDFWRISTGNATVSNVDTTDASGVAERVFYSTDARGLTLFANVGGSFSTSAGVTVNPAEATLVTSVATNNNSNVVASSTGSGADEASQITVTIEDAFGNRRPGDNVTLSSNQGGTTSFRLTQGGLSSPSGVTNSSGQFQRWFNGTLATSHTITAAVTPTLGTNFNEQTSVTVRAAPVDHLHTSAGTNQSTRVGLAVATDPAFLLHDVFNNPVPNTSVSFSVVEGGGLVGPLNGSSNGSGIATVNFFILGNTGTEFFPAHTWAGHFENRVRATSNGAFLDITAYSRYEFLDDVRPLFQADCDGCHDVTFTRSNILNQNPTTGTACDGSSLDRIVASNTNNSLIYRKVISNSPPCGARMPNGCSGAGCWGTTEWRILRSWINDGAPNN